MKSLSYNLISFILSLVPYLLAGWGYMDFTDGKLNSFWSALGVLIGVRTIYAFVEFVIGVIKWRLFGRKVAVQVILALFRNNDFPMRGDRDHNFYNYLFTITEDYVPEPSAKKVAKDIQDFLLFLDEITSWGIWSWRLSSAGDKALDIYSPRKTN